ncbi:lipoprotein-anchoring transpeptidase ErfK/SrfK [Pseudochelatococcus contaminans]|uniref:Lipoprotein-anchoring transpeptidase ErfK/SrfK n=1 Tax=Pseudochelatococcus contaminans TaxID=1538103 RepID=A0A7W5Z3V3_9HYPH|nr:lipoprotein-anchoring transpeptidase ErfK/SrfK [Pseudochelatococcus contaminans]
MISRRLFVIGAPLSLAACASTQPRVAEPVLPAIEPHYYQMYAALPHERFPIPAVDLTQIRPELLRREVAYPTDEQPGTIVIDPANHFLYLVRPEGRAIRYGVGVGRAGFDWDGRATIRRKAVWPTWTPPAEMIKRQPELEEYRRGMPPSLENPMGARALYLYQGDRDTLYRIHGTNDPLSIGQSMSSGCIRLLNQDIIDLHDRVPIGTKVVVLEAELPPELAGF